MKQLFVAAALVGLAACDADLNVKQNGAKDKVAIAGDADGRVKFDLPFANGDIKLPTSMLSSANFDIDGVKMMPGSKITGFNVNAGENKSRVDIGFTTSDSPAAVRDYFLQQFKAKGIAAQVSGDGFSGTSRDGDRFTMTLAQQGGGTQGKIAIDGKQDR